MEVSDKEIYEAVNQINPLEAPNTNGMQAILYHKT